MARRYSTNPFDDPSEEGLTFTDVTLLVFVLISGMALGMVLVLGTICADHRIISAVTALL